MKKLIAGALVASMCASMVACGAVKDKVKKSEEPSTNTTQTESQLHGKIDKVTDYLYEVTYDNYEQNYEGARELCSEFVSNMGGCSSVQNGKIRGRNYDWTYDEAAEFVVHVPKNENRHASVGVATISAISAEDVESGKDLDLYKFLPYLTLDGVNDAGMTFNVNVVNYGEKGIVENKTADTSDDISPLMIGRLVLDKTGTIEEAVELIKSMDIGTLGTQEETHFMISGPQSETDKSFNTVVVELIPDAQHHYQVNVIDNAKGEFVDNQPIMTNFHLTGFDGSMESLTKHPMGYERYLILKDAYDQGSTVSGMKDLMKKVYFSKMYDPYTNMVWYSELAKGDLTMANCGEQKINGDYSKAGDYAEEFKSNVEAYQNATRTSEEKVWHTVHTSVYDAEKHELSIIPQEAGFSYDFTLSGRK